MKQYTDILREILARGRLKVNRTGIDTIAIKGPSMRFHMDDGFPMVTERPIFFRGVANENIWFLEGKCNNEDLLAADIKIWDKWALKEDYTQEYRLQGYELADELLRIRNENLPEGQAPYTKNDIVKELTKADIEDDQKELPVNNNPRGATTWEELQGSYRVLRDAGVSLLRDRVLLPKGSLGPIYGVMWRNWPNNQGRHIDQIETVLAKLSSDNMKERYSRSLLVTALNPTYTPEESASAEENIKMGRQALAPCHTFFQLLAEPMTLEERKKLHNGDPDISVTGPGAADVTEEALHEWLDKLGVPRDQLSLIMYQRSADFPIGVPFNIAGYALLLHMFAHVLKMKPAEFVHHFGDAHIYVNQIEGVKELLRREEEQEVPALPTLWVNPEVTSIAEFKPEDFKLVNYNPIKPQINFGEIAV